MLFLRSNLVQNKKFGFIMRSDAPPPTGMNKHQNLWAARLWHSVTIQQGETFFCSDGCPTEED